MLVCFYLCKKKKKKRNSLGLNLHLFNTQYTQSFLIPATFSGLSVKTSVNIRICTDKDILLDPLYKLFD